MGCFYRIPIRAEDVPKLGVAVPTTRGPPLIAFPLTLPMGWVESPPYFTSATETACDMANRALRAGQPAPTVHRLEALALTSPPESGAQTKRARFVTRDWARATATHEGLSPPTPRPIASVDVYVDDFLLVAQTKRQQSSVLRHTLQSIDQVFRPLTGHDPQTRKEPISTKKLAQGDAFWAYRKRILGWDIDTVAETLELPPHRLARLHELLDTVQPPRKRMARSEWHRLLGKLRSMSAALPGSRGLFSILQAALSHGDRHRVRLN
jgi:hypothetical protein